MVSDERYKMSDVSQLTPIYPFDRSHIANLTVFKECLKYILNTHYPTSHSVTTLVLTLPPFMPHTIATNLDTLIAKDFTQLLPNLITYTRIPTDLPLTFLPAPHTRANKAPLQIVVHMGIAASTVSCYYNNTLLPLSPIRSTITLSLLTNWVGELLSYQSFNLTGNKELVHDFTVRACGRKGRYWLPENKGGMGVWEGEGEKRREETASGKEEEREVKAEAEEEEEEEEEEEDEEEDEEEAAEEAAAAEKGKGSKKGKGEHET